jgi:hypothetical protein
VSSFAAPSIASRFWRNACTRISRSCMESDVCIIDSYWRSALVVQHWAFSRITNPMSLAF